MKTKPTEQTQKPTPLTPEKAEAVLHRDLENLVGKVQNGKTLTATERAKIQALADGDDATKAKAWASDQVELAEILGVTRKTIARWRAKGAPPAVANGRWDVVAWRAWMKQNGKISGEGPEDTGPSRSQLEARKILLMNEKLEVEIGILRSEYIKLTDAENHVRGMVIEARKVLEQGPSALAPQVVGLTSPEAEKRLRDWVDDVCRQLHTGTISAA